MINEGAVSTQLIRVNILSDENGELIDRDCFDSGSEKPNTENGTFEISADFSAGTEYYFEIGTAAEEEISFDMDVPLPRIKTETDGGPIPFAGTILAMGYPRIVIILAVLAVGSAAALVIVKKKKNMKPAAADDAEKGSDASDQMEWVRRMNAVRAIATEIVIHDLIYT